MVGLGDSRGQSTSSSDDSHRSTSGQRHRIAPVRPRPTETGWMPASVNQRRTVERCPSTSSEMLFKLTIRSSGSSFRLDVRRLMPTAPWPWLTAGRVQRNMFGLKSRRSERRPRSAEHCGSFPPDTTTLRLAAGGAGRGQYGRGGPACSPNVIIAAATAVFLGWAS